ncbi:YcfL family protein [Cronobacter sakazakii]|uniref:YcfL family protein n=1 Tax=Cronobacter sakazakii TaxID=28141 RepID=UPI000CF02E17|nr:YcfL family protein [Cronobacter sakazakii]EJQ2006056.1 YcfL family protein [Cronobacter sakazakii]EJQ2088012.1 YcfL family protein [Cronobacter sakazakii]EJR9311978.1 YcfL family protein [Cronobacter sakazakii]EJR9316600.1 YcfL family protein [Cronobacter sakazakii]EJR9321132.1 YcfL family protein [Cronobacter sakazakii]
MARVRTGWLLAALLMAGCRSTPTIPVGDEQAIVMESSVLAAGITAEKPGFSLQNGKPVAAATIYNNKDAPVTVHYRFYWYDARGLEGQPLEVPQTVVIPAQGRVTVTSQTNYLAARKARLYLYL